MIYIGSDFPDEYAHSKDTKVLRGPNEYAKANASVAIKELIQIATNKAFSENHKDKHNSKAKYGWYRYDTMFAIPKYDNDGELAGYNIFKGRLVIRHAQDEKLYLYDILRIKKKRVSRLSKNCTVVKLISCLAYYNKNVLMSIRILEIFGHAGAVSNSIHTADIAYITQQPRGIFTAIGKLVDAGILSEEETKEYWENREYFERVLPVPPFYDMGNPDKAVTWFKNTLNGNRIYSDMTFYRKMAKMYGVQLFMTECDEAPGEVIHQDDFQIAIKNQRTDINITTKKNEE